MPGVFNKLPQPLGGLNQGFGQQQGQGGFSQVPSAPPPPGQGQPLRQPGTPFGQGAPQGAPQALGGAPGAMGSAPGVSDRIREILLSRLGGGF